MYKPANTKQSFPELEKEILAFWKENKTFLKSLKIRKDSEEFNFYDGPPFATGTPHYGHLVGGTLKDIIPRYQTMKGKYVERRFGWDCHGLPIENIVEKKLGISGKLDIENKIGVFNFNEECRKNVMIYVDEWRKTVERMGRWVDMDNDYKTMDADFMESVWWVFKSLFDKGYIYESQRVVPYCTRCSTPIANFEVNQGYEDRQDKSVTVKFKILSPDSRETYILAWTTTPWTLPANLGLAVGKDIEYVEILDSKTQEKYILAKDRLGNYYKNEEDYKILAINKGEHYVGTKYEPLFDDWKINFGKNENLPKEAYLGENAYSVVIGHHVTTDSGTGIVHIAPAYGEDDSVIGKNEKLGYVAHIDDTGKVENLLDHNGEYVFDFNENVIKILKEKGIIINISTIDHSYPHCYRCKTPLIYRGISAWYVKVEENASKLVKNNEEINWMPENIKYGRFGNWIEGARDWNISRNRYWGSAMPIWRNEDKTETICVGSIEELYELNKDFGQIEKRNNNYFYTDTGIEVDLHKHYVDKILLKNVNNSKAKNVLGIHGFLRNKDVIDFLEGTKNNLKKDGIIIDTPKFEEGTIIDYKNWETKLNELDLTNYDTVFTHSMGGRVAIEYIIEHKINLDRLIMIAPGIEGSGTKEVVDFYSTMKHGLEELKKFVKEIIILVSRDDLKVRAEQGQRLAKIIGANLIEVNGYGHFNVTECKLIEGLIKYGIPLKRIPEVLDCWFESGSMPYASKHYPFAGDNLKYPGDFIAEGQDQTRGWFYTLLVLGTLLFDRTPFLNVIVNGTVLAEDGKKMSKSLNNYPDPELLINKHGADALRFYMMNSPIVKADDLRFSEAGVEETVKKVILPLWNTYSFFVTYANIDNFEGKEKNVYQFINDPNFNKLDLWILSELQELIKNVSDGFEKYDINAVTRPIFDFMDNLTNWYIRRSRRRFWKSENDNDKLFAYNTLYEVLVEVTKVIAPIMPFISEYIYKDLTNKESVHLEFYPELRENMILGNLNKDMEKTQKIVNLGLALRGNKKIRVRQPLQSITIGEKLDNYYLEIIKEELNVKEVIFMSDMSQIALKICKPNARLIGPRFGGAVQNIIKMAKEGLFEELSNGGIKVGEYELNQGEFEIAYEPKSGVELDIQAGFGIVVAINTEISSDLLLEGYARDLVRAIQDARKEANYIVTDRISLNIKGSKVEEIMSLFGEYIESETLAKLDSSLNSGDISKNVELDDLSFEVILRR